MSFLRKVIASEQRGDELINVGFDEYNQFGVEKIKGERHELSPLRDVRGQKCLLCDRCWESTVVDLTNQFYMMDHEGFVHETCLVNHMMMNQHALFNDVLSRLRLRRSLLKKIPNQYGGAWNTPWFETQLSDHDVKITFGQRKRVYEIIFECCLDDKIKHDFEAFFSNEKVTHAFSNNTMSVHAWTDEKVHEYVKIMLSLFVKQKEDNDDVAKKSQ